MTLLKDQGDISGVVPMPTDRVDDTSVVNPVIAETVAWEFLSTGAFATATGESAGTICTAKLEYDGITNSMGSNVGTLLDTSVSFGATTRVDSIAECPMDILSKMAFMSPTDQIATITPYLTTNGEYIIDHRRGQIWMISKDTVADDSIDYKYKTPVSGGSSGDKVDITKVNGTTVNEGGVSGSLGVGGNTAHGDESTGNPVTIGGEAKSGQQTAVTDGKTVKGVFNLFGELVVAGYSWAANAIRVKIIDPLNLQYLNEHLVDGSNEVAATYRSEVDMKGRKSGSLQWNNSGGVTMTVWATNDASADTTADTGWEDITTSITGNGSEVDNSGIAFLDTNLIADRIMIKRVLSDATNASDIFFNKAY